MVRKIIRIAKKICGGNFQIAKIDSKKIGNQLNQEEINSLFETTRKIISNVVIWKHKPIIVRNEKTEVLPINLKGINWREIESMSIVLLKDLI